MHIDAMLSRLPLLYREGELLRQVLQTVAMQLEILDEDGIEVQRAHFFETALELQEAARLAAVLAIPQETWQHLGEYRVWVDSLRDAMLQKGAVTKEALQYFVTEYATRYQDATNIKVLFNVQSWSDTPSTVKPAFVEMPLLRRLDRIPQAGGIEPLQQFSIHQKGLDKTFADFLLVGLPTGPESVPAVINLTTREALIFLGNVPPGQRLWITSTSDGKVKAELEGKDVSSQLRYVTNVQAGTPWNESEVKQPAQAISLVPGKNDLWFLPVAIYDALGLDRFLMALADLVLMQGRFDQSQFDHALFYQDPAVHLHLSWVETQPATFAIVMPAGGLLSPKDKLNDALQSRENLGFSLNLAIKDLKAAGVAGSVEMRMFQEVQAQRDYLRAVMPVKFREAGSVGADSLPETGGAYDVSKFGNSTFR